MSADCVCLLHPEAQCRDAVPLAALTSWQHPGPAAGHTIHLLIELGHSLYEEFHEDSENIAVFIQTRIFQVVMLGIMQHVGAQELSPVSFISNRTLHLLPAGWCQADGQCG